VLSSPAFGQADLTNCERELIHLAGSVQPHGALLVLREAELVVAQASANAAAVIGVDAVVGRSLAEFGGDLDSSLRKLAAASDLTEPAAFICHAAAGAGVHAFEGTAFRQPGGVLIVELEPVDDGDANLTANALLAQVGAAVQRFSSTPNIGTLADAVVQCLREMTGYDRVMVYKFDPDGHGKIIAEARDPRLDSLLGHHYPASDIPQRARDLYVRNRVRVLADVHYEPVPIEPRLHPQTGAELDMSLCQLRSMSPLHIQYLKNMGVTATLVVSLVREGRLWGLIACHHYSPRRVRYPVRAACGLLAEVIATRIAAIENYTHAQVAIMVRRLEQRLVEATSVEGDWRLALFRNPRTLLQPLEATGAALFYEGEMLTAGEVPSTPELRQLREWVEVQQLDPLFNCSSVARANPALDSLTPTASGVLAVRLSRARPDFLMWFRKEQLQTVMWAGDPTKPVIGNDPLDLSPRRSFAAWSEIVRGTALPWSSAELALARAIGTALVDIIVQVHAVRLLVAEHQLGQVRATVENSSEPVLIANAQGRLLFANSAFTALVATDGDSIATMDRVPALFSQPAVAGAMIDALCGAFKPWRGELALARGAAEALPVSVRAEMIPGRDGAPIGFILILADLSENKRAATARRNLEESLSRVWTGVGEVGERLSRESDEVISAILTNASLAAMDITDAAGTPAAAPLLEELEAATLRATSLYGQIRSFSRS
jgi:two-component system, chemotaxis family, sensor kinase Cph1